MAFLSKGVARASRGERSNVSWVREARRETNLQSFSERGGRDEPKFKVIDVICKLSKKLPAAATSTSECIETVSGRGYALRDPERR